MSVVIPNARVFSSGPRDLRWTNSKGAGDPSLRLKSGSAQDDALGNQAGIGTMLAHTRVAFEARVYVNGFSSGGRLLSDGKRNTLSELALVPVGIDRGGFAGGVESGHLLRR